jgi:plasmid stabilization system protein ParE
MADKPLVIHPAALEELQSAVTWYLGRSEVAAAKFVASVDRAIDAVIESPSRWPLGESSTRKFVLRRFPFAIIYRETMDSLQILAVAHGNRKPGYWKKRL